MSGVEQGQVVQEPGGPNPDPQVEAVKMEGLETIRALMRLVRAEQNPEIIQRCAAATLAIAQAVVILDPKLVAPQGVPPDALQPPRAAVAKDPDTPSNTVYSGRG